MLEETRHKQPPGLFKEVKSTINHNNTHLQVADIAGKGKGVVVGEKAIKKGELVCEYVGECISYDEAIEREKGNLKLHREYKGFMFFFKFKEKKLW